MAFDFLLFSVEGNKKLIPVAAIERTFVLTSPLTEHIGTEKIRIVVLRYVEMVSHAETRWSEG